MLHSHVLVRRHIAHSISSRGSFACIHICKSKRTDASTREVANQSASTTLHVVPQSHNIQTPKPSISLPPTTFNCARRQSPKAHPHLPITLPITHPNGILHRAPLLPHTPLRLKPRQAPRPHQRGRLRRLNNPSPPRSATAGAGARTRGKRAPRARRAEPVGGIDGGAEGGD